MFMDNSSKSDKSKTQQSEVKLAVLQVAQRFIFYVSLRTSSRVFLVF